ncbi:MAG: C25 family cysteine peptidase, partial [Bacteroidota bacterium]|nr:C25 family cysteine peptidase [Bacteroidota bacterium]
MRNLFVLLIVVFLCNLFAKGQDSFLYDNETICITKDFGKLDTLRITSPFGTFYSLHFDKQTAFSSCVGQAKLPQFVLMIDLPTCEDFLIEEKIIEKTTFVLDKDIKIEPKQPSLFKNNEDTSFCVDKSYYSINEFDKKQHTSIKKEGIMGGVLLGKIVISPIRYNPKQNIIEFVNKIEVKIKFLNRDEAKQTTLKRKMSRSFKEFCFAKDIRLSTKNQTIVDDVPYSMVVVSPIEYKGALEDFLKWKRRQGFNIIPLYTNQIGTTANDIKSYLTSLYNTDTLACFDYLLICGDVEQVPSFEVYSVENEQGIHCTDLYYADYTQDSLPDVFYGRISARDSLELKNILDKTIIYESYAFENDDFLDKSLIVAGYENKFNAPKLIDGQNNYIKTYLSPLMDTSIYYHNQSLEHRDNILNEIQEGKAWVNYTAHCSYNGWYNPTITTEEINNLSNIGKYGLFINNCCLSGKFNEQECFTESLLRQVNGGAVASIGASDNTLWEEDYYWSVGYKSFSYTPVYNANSLGLYDKYFHTHNEPAYQHSTTVGQMLFDGWLAVMQSCSQYSAYYREIYNLQGDPSLMAYAGKGRQIVSDYEKNIPVGTQTITFNTQPNAYVCLSNDNNIISVSTANNNGEVVLDVSSVDNLCSVYLVISHQFFKPSIDTLFFVAPQEGFASINNISLTRINTNSEVDYLEENTTYAISFDLKNIGLSSLLFDHKSIEASFPKAQDICLL